MPRSAPLLLTSGLFVAAITALVARLPACHGGTPGDRPAASPPASDEEPWPSDLTCPPTGVLSPGADAGAGADAG